MDFSGMELLLLRALRAHPRVLYTGVQINQFQSSFQSNR